MAQRLVLASSSDIRLKMLRQAGLSPDVRPASIDETGLKEALLRHNSPPDLVARELAVAKAKDVSEIDPEAMVIGADQVLVLDGVIFSKPRTPADAMAQLSRLQGRPHTLISAVAVAEKGEVHWQTRDQVTLEMRTLSDAFIQRYVQEDWPKIRWSVGCYLIEDRGVALFKTIDGDYHTILGLPLLDLLTYLECRGVLSL